MSIQFIIQPTNRSRVVLFAITAALIALFTMACEPEAPRLAQSPLTPPPLSAADPQTWIEFPVEGQTLPMAPVPFVAYAADPLNVVQIDLRVNGQPLPLSVVNGMDVDGGYRLARLDHTWQPPAEGQYIVEARARNSAGTIGPPSYVKFCVGSCQPLTPTPALRSTNTPTAAPKPADTSTPIALPATTPTNTATPVTAPAVQAQYDLYVHRMDFGPNLTVGQSIQLFIMIATNTYPSSGPFFPASNLRWRQGAEFPWNEEVCPTNVQYAQCSKTVALTYTQPGIYHVEVEADNRNVVPETDEGNNARYYDLTIGPAQIAPPPPVAASIDFRSDAPYVNGGNCTTLRWDVENVNAVFVDGQGVTGHGSKQVCPCQQTTYTLRVIKRDNAEENRQVTIGVYGSCAAPPPAPPSDTTGPSISNVRLDQEGCELYGRANISDPSSVSQAKFRYNIGGGTWNSIWMSDKGGGLWESEAGIKITGGVMNIEFAVWASDQSNNEQTSPSSSKTVAVTGCGGF